MTSSTPHRVGVYLAFVQFFFTITWTIYVIFLPSLAVQASIPKQYVIYILMLDQMIFMVMDFGMGVMADRVSRVLGRLGYIVLAVTLVSCLAFLLLPFAAPQGAAWLFLLLTIAWTASSSALRAPPLMLLGKYIPAPRVPWLSALSLFGLGVAGAIGPYLTIVLRETDPKLPFALSSIALALATLGIIWAERALAQSAGAAEPAAVTPPKPLGPVFWFFVAVLLLAFGYQIHFSLNSAALYQRFIKPPDVPYYMPIFWIGFNLLMLPASMATKRYGGLAVTGAGGVIAAVASFAAWHADNLNMLVAMQFIAGGGWGFVLMSAVSAALAIGHTGREGKITGGLFALLALATCARIAIVAGQLDKQFASALDWLPVAAWGVGGVVLLLLIFVAPKQSKLATT